MINPEDKARSIAQKWDIKTAIAKFIDARTQIIMYCDDEKDHGDLSEAIENISKGLNILAQALRESAPTITDEEIIKEQDEYYSDSKGFFTIGARWAQKKMRGEV